MDRKLHLNSTASGGNTGYLEELGRQPTVSWKRVGGGEATCVLGGNIDGGGEGAKCSMQLTRFGGIYEEIADRKIKKRFVPASKVSLLMFSRDVYGCRCVRNCFFVFFFVLARSFVFSSRVDRKFVFFSRVVRIFCFMLVTVSSDGPCHGRGLS